MRADISRLSVLYLPELVELQHGDLNLNDLECLLDELFERTLVDDVQRAKCCAGQQQTIGFLHRGDHLLLTHQPISHAVRPTSHMPRADISRLEYTRTSAHPECKSSPKLSHGFSPGCRPKGCKTSACFVLLDGCRCAAFSLSTMVSFDVLRRSSVSWYQ